MNFVGDKEKSADGSQPASARQLAPPQIDDDGVIDENEDLPF